jgi:peptidyl-prolyl cis-trans isomerase C
MKRTKKDMNLRQLVAWTIILFSIMIVLFCSKDNKTNDQQSASFSDSTVVAMINGKAIHTNELDLAVKQFLMRLGKNPDFFIKQPKDTVIYREALNWLISLDLLAEEADENKIKVDENKIELTFNNFKRNFPSEQKFLDFLAENDLSLENFKKKLADEIKVQELLDQKITSKIAEITDKEALEYYNNNSDKFLQNEHIRVHHILIKVIDPNDPKKVEVAENKARGILDKIKKGGNFEELARQYSEDPSAFKGGDLGFFTRGDMIKEFEDVAFALKIGETSDVARTPIGFHIIKLTEKKSSQLIPFQEVESQIKAQVKQERSNSLFEDYVNELKSKAKIKVKDLS